MMEFKEVTYKVMDSSDFDDLVNGIYGCGYEYVADEEAHNDSCYTYTVTGKISDSEYIQKKVANIRAENHEHMTARLMLDMLAADGIIPTGMYMIEVCW